MKNYILLIVLIIASIIFLYTGLKWKLGVIDEIRKLQTSTSNGSLLLLKKESTNFFLIGGILLFVYAIDSFYTTQAVNNVEKKY